MIAGPFDGHRAVVDRLHAEALGAQDLAQQIPGDGVILGHQYPGHALPPAATSGRASLAGGCPRSGRRTVNTDPSPAVLSTSILPPSDATSSRQIASPRPVPLPRPLVV